MTNDQILNATEQDALKAVCPVSHKLISAKPNPYGITLECEICEGIFTSIEHAMSINCKGD